MTLPLADAACVDGAKLRDYLVSTSHLHGRRKARAFARLAFDSASCDELAGELLRVARNGRVTERVLTVYGMKYVVDGVICGPLGAHPARTVWLLERGACAPRLLTAALLEVP